MSQHLSGFQGERAPYVTKTVKKLRVNTPVNTLDRTLKIGKWRKFYIIYSV
ncbi:MAG: hypothetical protein F6J93_04315 [Oscillatoria sp. SIO1A7]|nr:hypothetical protein [Oscillatoria sp. SIO1A7]